MAESSTPHAAPSTRSSELSVRSVVLSLALGAHPNPTPSRQLVAAGAHFGLPEPGIRVALTRALAAGELERSDGGYGLGLNLLERHRRQQQALQPDFRDWQGGWETAYVVAAGRPAGQRRALRDLLSEHRLAELREGVWLRPDNLVRPAAYDGHPDLMVCRSHFEDPVFVSRTLWPLDAWAERGRDIEYRLRTGDSPPLRLATASELVRHLTTDPMLPPSLLPDSWPGQTLRRAYDAYQHELRSLVAVA